MIGDDNVRDRLTGGVRRKEAEIEVTMTRMRADIDPMIGEETVRGKEVEIELTIVKGVRNHVIEIDARNHMSWKLTERSLVRERIQWREGIRIRGKTEERMWIRAMEMRRELGLQRLGRRKGELAMWSLWIRRFDDKVKEEEEDVDVEIDEKRKGKAFDMRAVKEEPKLEPYDYGQDVGSIVTSMAMGSYK